MARTMTSAPIRARRRTERIAISSPGDFVLGPREALGHVDELLPYCLDFVRRRSLYVGGADAKGAQDAPFYYLHLRRHAARLVSVPWEHGSLTAETGAPVFLFSPGRCGSTLLSALLSNADIANVSEPDFYTQATMALPASALNPFRTRITSAAAAMGRDLAAVLGAAPVVKLRAESCRAPWLLVADTEPRTLFMSRVFEAWARSNQRAFRNGAAKTVGKYLTALRGYAWLRTNSRCHAVRYEDLVAAPEAAAQALGAFLGRDISGAVAASTMKEDSQRGTPLEQGARGDLPGWEQRFDETMALWNSAKVRRLREGLGAEDLCAG